MKLSGKEENKLLIATISIIVFWRKSVDINSILGREKELLSFMKENGYSVFHRSNIFLRDFQYGIRDYFRAKENIDIGSRKSDEYADILIRDLEKKGIIKPLRENTWLLNMEDFMKKPKIEEPVQKDTED